MGHILENISLLNALGKMTFVIDYLKLALVINQSLLPFICFI